jgi:hypothetical protein
MKMRHINLHYCRAAIEANTGVYGLSLEQVRQYLVEEGLITAEEARKYAPIFTGYAEFFELLEEAEAPEPDTNDWATPLDADD